MPDNMAALTSPDLSNLAEDTRLRLRVAVAAGATWENRGGGWMLHGNRAFRGKVLLLPHGQLAVGWKHLVPDWPSFPAAWGALMEAERISLRPSWSGWEARFEPPTEESLSSDEWHEGDNPGRAVCFAVLLKYGMPRL